MGDVAEPGFKTVCSIPRQALNIIPPVSVCHQVSIIGHRSFPIVLKYHIQTSGLIGSPTVPKSLKDDRSKELGISSPCCLYIRRAVGTVWNIVTPLSCIILQ